MSLAFAPARPFTSTPNQQPTLDAELQVLLAELLDAPDTLPHDQFRTNPVGPAIVLDGDDDDDEDEDEDDFFEDDEDEEWEDDYEDDLDDDEDEEFEDDFEDDEEL